MTAAEIIAVLRKTGQTLALAESCTGGLVAAAITEVAGCSDVFLGSAVTYSNASKTDLLGVPNALLEAHGAVSEEVARAMAEGARAKYGASIAVAVTGIAGPGGGSAQKPVGLVFIARACASGTQTARHHFSGTREQIRQAAVQCVLMTISARTDL